MLEHLHEISLDDGKRREPDASMCESPVVRAIVEQTRGAYQVSSPRLHMAAQSDARAVAARVVAAWAGIDSALSPVIGRKGVAALYKRSLHMVAVDHPWLASVAQEVSEPGDFSALETSIGQQAVAQGVAAHAAMLKKFREMLTNLIGESLTERLLQPVWPSVVNGLDEQDKS